ncbi:hypothetical protein FQR65_LT02298 [Abscondita terminalis]|nr:hypothetical protein FQR65_LT02298 [Abscondita terminalis]
MSHKISIKRSKKHADEEVPSAEFKAPETTKTKDETVKNSKNSSESTNGEESKGSSNKSPSKDENSTQDNVTSENGDGGIPKRSMQTRSCSNTTSKKNVDSTNGVKDEEPKTEETVEVAEVKDTIAIEKSEEPKQTKEKTSNSPSNSVEMDPLILDKDDEEAIPELQFDENDVEVESEGSNSRCKTRRSQSRNISTPKTPKTVEPEEFEIVDQFLDIGGSATPKPVTPSIEAPQSSILCEIDLNDTSDTQSSVSTSNVSTKAVSGSDATRNVELTGYDSGLFEDSTSFSNTANKSFGDTLKNLSGRRAIRTLGTPYRTDYRRRVLKKTSTENKGDLYADYESVEQISMGIKRKSRSFSPIHSKRMKRETSNFLSYFSNPFSNFRSSLKRSSTPKLITMETKCEFDDNEKFDKVNYEIGAENEKKWCSVM